VVLAQMGNYKKAINHFQKTIHIDSSYQKAHHNLAMALFVTENDVMALDSVNKALNLSPESRNSMLLKSSILNAMGKHAEAKRIKEEAMFLPSLIGMNPHQSTN
jgi:Tfp pilus assembly protein PilF